MKNVLSIANRRNAGLAALTGLALCLQAHLVEAHSLIDGQRSETVVNRRQSQPLSLEQRVQASYDAYILGPGDRLYIELLDLPELSGSFTIGPDGTLYMPRLRALNVEGLTVEELRNLLTKQFSPYVRDPQLYIRPIAYRPVRIYVGGEVKRPGYYTLTQGESKRSEGHSQSVLPSESYSPSLLPTVFDAIRSANGVTPYTDLAKVEVTRKRAEGLGGGRIKTSLNFLSLITEGDESQNIRLFDGDVLNVGKSPVVLREQLVKAGQSNLSPQFMEVFVTGRVNNPGGVRIPQGSSLNQAISVAGGTKLLKGRIEFVRFHREGTLDRRIFAYSPQARIDAPNNPILAAGDLIRVQDSILSGSVNILNEVTGPIVGIYSIYNLFNNVAQ